MKKTKGYITVYSLIIALFLFSVIGYLVISFSSNSKVNENSYEYLQGVLIAESINNKIIEENIFSEKFSGDDSKFLAKSKFKIHIDEFDSDYNIKVNTLVPDEKYILTYKVDYNKILLYGHTEILREEKNPDYSILNRPEEEVEIYLDKLNKIEGYYRPKDIYIFNYENNLYEVEKDIYSLLLEEYEGDNFDETLIEYSKILDKKLIIDTNNIGFLDDNIKLEGFFIDRGNLSLNTLELSGIYISKEKSKIDNLNIKGGIYCTENINGNYSYKEEICEDYYIDDFKEINFKFSSFNIS